MSSLDQLGGGSRDTANPALESLTRREDVTVEAYLDLVRNEDDQEFKLLEWMYPFFTGEFNHHDVMMISNCSRTRLDKMLEKHSCILEKFWL
jgi:hypothetical protein